MDEAILQSSAGCRGEDIAAFLDGELDPGACALFEEHSRICSSCSTELQEQRRLLCALDFALGDNQQGVVIPQNFAQIVAAHAENDMSGLRRRVERRRALGVAAILSMMIVVVLGSASLNVLIALKAASRYLLSVLGLTWHALFDAATGIAVIVRALGRRFIFELHPLNLVTLLLFVIALLLLPRLISRYHRRQITE